MHTETWLFNRWVLKTVLVTYFSKIGRSGKEGGPGKCLQPWEQLKPGSGVYLNLRGAQTDRERVRQREPHCRASSQGVNGMQASGPVIDRLGK